MRHGDFAPGPRTDWHIFGWPGYKQQGLVRTVARVLWLASMAVGVASAYAQMTIPGEFSVSQTGAATYTIPIQVPPGIAGLQPKLSLVYSSQAGNGLLGAGWALAGLPTITRCPQSLAQDGAIVAVKYAASDRFCLDGKRLVLVAGTYGVSGSEYRTERESFSRIVASGSTGSGPSSFVVNTKDGLTMEFGNSADSRVLAVGNASVRVWALNKVTDVNSNYMTVTYNSPDSVNGQLYPLRISYTGNGATPPSKGVYFDYSFTRTDAYKKYDSGGAILKGTALLTSIRTTAGSSNAAVSSYTFGYAAVSPATGRQRLASVTQCDAGGSCLKATTPTWSSTLPQLAVGTAKAIGGWGQGRKYLSSDIDGDGLTDLIEVWTSNNVNAKATTWVSSKSGYVQKGVGDIGGWKDGTRYLVADINADGLTDLIQIWTPDGVVAKVTPWTSNGSTFVEAPVSNIGGWKDDTVYFIADTNSDGRSDVVQVWKDGDYAKTTVWLSDGGKLVQGPISVIGGWRAGTAYYAGDVNGDGLVDLIEVWSADGVNAKATTWISNGSSGFVLGAERAIGGWRAATQYLVADTNGDGLSDLLQILNLS